MSDTVAIAVLAHLRGRVSARGYHAFDLKSRFCGKDHAGFVAVHAIRHGDSLIYLDNSGIIARTGWNRRAKRTVVYVWQIGVGFSPAMQAASDLARTTEGRVVCKKGSHHEMRRTRGWSTPNWSSMARLDREQREALGSVAELFGKGST